MDVTWSEQARRLEDELRAPMQEHVLPAEPVYEQQRGASEAPHAVPPVLVPMDTPEVRVVPSTRVLGCQDRDGHAETTRDDVRVPASNLLAGEEDRDV